MLFDRKILNYFKCPLIRQNYIENESYINEKVLYISQRTFLKREIMIKTSLT